MVMHGARRGYADYDAMLADPDVDAVIIATADAFHVPASLRALEVGKHVLCESRSASRSKSPKRWPLRWHAPPCFPAWPYEAVRSRPSGG